jgi:Lrp/AsnC family transcriptional regulator for asnA, asnC and gidA
MDKNLEIDNVDFKILSLLMEDANMPYTEIGKKIYVSGGTVHVRMKKMEQMGIVKGSQLNIDHSKLGWDISAFLGIYLDKSSLYDGYLQHLCKINLPRYPTLAPDPARQDSESQRYSAYRNHHLTRGDH